MSTKTYQKRAYNFLNIYTKTTIMKKALISILAVAATLVACQKNDVTVKNNPREVRFTVTNLGNYQFKSATLGLGEDGCSTVGIYAEDLFADNVEATVSGTTLTPSSTIYWGVDQTANSTFVARYPYAGGAAVSGEYTITPNQSAIDDFSYHANVMHAVTSANPDPGTVAFTFVHPFAKVSVDITNNLGADAVASVILKNVKQTASVLNLGTVPATITLSDAKSDVTAYATSATKYEMIVMPQSATSEMDIVVTTVKNCVYTFRITGDYTFKAGKVATAEVTLNPTSGASGAPLGVISFAATDWTDDDDTTVGTIGTPVLGEYWTVFGNVYSTADKDDVPDAWSKNYPMLYSAANTWTITLNYDDSASDDSGKGFKFKLGDTYYGTSTEEAPVSGATLVSPGYNIKLTSAGKYNISFNDSTHALTFTRTGDAE